MQSELNKFTDQSDIAYFDPCIAIPSVPSVSVLADANMVRLVKDFEDWNVVEKKAFDSVVEK